MQIVKSIPVGIASWAIFHKKHKALHLLVQIKNNSNGIFHKCHLDDLFKCSGIKSKRTFENKLLELQKIGWLNYNQKTGWFKILSFERILRLINCSLKRTIEISPDTTKENFQSFLFAGVLSFEIKKTRYFYIRNKFGKKIAREKFMAFEFFDRDIMKYRRYIALSMGRIAKQLNISRQRANILKCSADKNGFIECYEHKQYLGTVTSDMCRYKHMLSYNGFVIFKKGRDKVIRAYRIMPDEINSNLRVKRKFSLTKGQDNANLKNK